MISRPPLARTISPAFVESAPARPGSVRDLNTRMRAEDKNCSRTHQSYAPANHENLNSFKSWAFGLLDRPGTQYVGIGIPTSDENSSPSSMIWLAKDGSHHLTVSWSLSCDDDTCYQDSLNLHNFDSIVGRLTPMPGAAEPPPLFFVTLGDAPQEEGAISAENLAALQRPSNREASKPNLRHACDALRYVRAELYNKPGGLKSTNKFNASKRELEKTRAADRRRPGGARLVDRSLPVAMQRELVWNSNIQNCFELTLAVTHWAERNGLSSAMVNIPERGGHMFAVIGIRPGDPLPDDIDRWPLHWGICDVWANIACEPPDYRREFENKMKKWEASNKRIDDGDQWARPVTWLRGEDPGGPTLLDGPKKWALFNAAC
ncbi:MAG: hypothetical protein Q7T63_09080 [Burkholderiaceae bacterium]|nr:hypothetical protein [Burkholderiaceae bacterium]MDO9088539.1 hypothetical protein [Burkholderiaceae bacterium]